MVERIVIVGSSIGGMRTAAELRAAGFGGSIILVDPEAKAPYDRPPLSKQVLRGSWAPDEAALGESGSRGESHPPAPTERCVNLSVHTALVI